MAGTASISLKATWLAMQVAGRFSTRLGGALASQIWFTPWQVPVSERGLKKQARWLAQTDSLTFEIDGQRIEGFTAGSGPNILLIHGWGERTASLGAFVQPLIESGYRVLGIDLPRHGDTSRGKTNIFEMANAVRGVADQVGGIHAVIAHSMGGIITMVALSEGLSVESVVLIAPASNVDHALEKFGVNYSLPHKALAGLRANIERRFGAGVWKRLDGKGLARNFRVPALIAHDRTDNQIDLDDSEALAAAWPDSQFVVTAGLGHSKISRDPQVVEMVRNFLVETAEPWHTEPFVRTSRT